MLFFSTDKICAFFLAWKFDPTFALSPETPRGRFQLVKEDSKIPQSNRTKNINNDILMTSSAKLISKQDSFVKDWEVSILYIFKLETRNNEVKILTHSFSILNINKYYVK